VIDRIAVIGHPSHVGGADTELDHQIRCWHAMGIEVHLCPTHTLDGHLRSMRMEERGCIYHAPADWQSLAGMHSIAFCNGGFLEQIERIKRYVKTTTFVNCMTWNFPKEIEAQRRDLIDFHLYQTDHGMQKVGEALAKVSNHYRPLRFKPYFHAADFPYIDDRPKATFRFGRISRPDADKFNGRQMWIYETMATPIPKEGMILGWDGRVQDKVGLPPSYIYTRAANTVSQQAFYRFCDAIIMTTDTFENLPRVGFEAMASGSVLVVDDRGGWREQVEQGVTGWLCKDDREFVYRASRLAFEPEEQERMRKAARRRLEDNWGLEACMASWASVFSQITSEHRSSPAAPPIESTSVTSHVIVQGGHSFEKSQIFYPKAVQPRVSCIMPTYGRPDYVSESIAMFLSQDYPNKELIVLNDCPGQTFQCDCKDVIVINRPNRFASLGEKRNECILRSTGDLIAVWDDDDLYLPWHLRFTVEQMRLHKTEFYRAAEFWAYWGEDHLSNNKAIKGWISHPQVLYTKELWNRVGGYPAMNVGEDAAFFRRIHTDLGKPFIAYPLAKHQRYYILRGRSRYRHMSIKGGVEPLDIKSGDYQLIPKAIADEKLRLLFEKSVAEYDLAERAEPPFVIVGTGRSGSTYIARLLRECGIPCGHEQWWNPFEKRTPGLKVDSSWCVVPFLEAYRGVIWHQVRDPRACIASLLANEVQRPIKPYWSLRQRLCSISEDQSELDKSVELYLTWNSECERFTNTRWRVEHVDGALLGKLCANLGYDVPGKKIETALARVPNQCNHRASTIPLEWSDLEQYPHVIEMATRYGYR